MTNTYFSKLSISYISSRCHPKGDLYQGAILKEFYSSDKLMAVLVILLRLMLVLAMMPELVLVLLFLLLVLMLLLMIPNADADAGAGACADDDITDGAAVLMAIRADTFGWWCQR